MAPKVHTVTIDGVNYLANLHLLVTQKVCQEDYTLGFVYYIKVATTHWLDYPAVMSDDSERIIFTTSKDLINKVLGRMPKGGIPIIRECVFFIHRNMEVGYQMSDTMERFRERFPIRLLTEKEFKSLVDHDQECPFKWTIDIEEDLEKSSLLEDFRGFKPAKNT